MRYTLFHIPEGRIMFPACSWKTAKEAEEFWQECDIYVHVKSGAEKPKYFRCDDLVTLKNSYLVESNELMIIKI